MNKDITVGLDLGDRYSRFCVLDGEGAVIEEDRVRANSAKLRVIYENPRKSSCRVGLAPPLEANGVSRALNPSIPRMTSLNVILALASSPRRRGSLVSSTILLEEIPACAGMTGE